MFVLVPFVMFGFAIAFVKFGEFLGAWSLAISRRFSRAGAAAEFVSEKAGLRTIASA